MARTAKRRLNPIKKINISFPLKTKVHKSLAISILLNGCESLVLTAVTGWKIQAFEYYNFRKIQRKWYGECKKKKKKLSVLAIIYKTNCYVSVNVYLFKTLGLSFHNEIN